MAATEERESVVDLGRKIADDAVRLVRAEVDLAKARLKAMLLSLALGVAFVLAALSAFSLTFFFTVGTVDEGTSLNSNWAMGAAVIAVIVAALLFFVAAKVSPLSAVAGILGGLSLLGSVVLAVGYFVGIIVAGEPREGWAISALIALGLGLIFSVVAAWLLWRAKKRGFGTLGTLKEDAEWLNESLRGLRKPNGSAS